MPGGCGPRRDCPVTAQQLADPIEKQVSEAARAGRFAVERVDNRRLRKWLKSPGLDEVGTCRI